MKQSSSQPAPQHPPVKEAMCHAVKVSRLVVLKRITASVRRAGGFHAPHGSKHDQDGLRTLTLSLGYEWRMKEWVRREGENNQNEPLQDWWVMRHESQWHQHSNRSSADEWNKHDGAFMIETPIYFRRNQTTSRCDDIQTKIRLKQCREFQTASGKDRSSW